MLESTSSVYWDCDKYPDYKLFIKAARTAGAQVIVFSPTRVCSGNK